MQAQQADIFIHPFINGKVLPTADTLHNVSCNGTLSDIMLLIVKLDTENLYTPKKGLYYLYCRFQNYVTNPKKTPQPECKFYVIPNFKMAALSMVEREIKRQIEYDEMYDETDDDIIYKINVPGEDDTQIV